MKVLPLLFIYLSFTNAQDDEFSKCDPKCVFTEGVITPKNLGSFPKCAKVCAHLLIDDTSGVTEKQLTTAFKSMRTLIGSFEMYDTDFKSASFLAGVQRIESASMGITIFGNKELVNVGWKNLTTMTVYYFDVYNNDKLKKLNMPKWKTFSCPTKGCTTTGIINNYYEPKFCFTTLELKALTGPRVFKPMLTGEVCAPNKSNKKVCTKPTAGCQEMVGDLNIGAKFDVKKVKALKALYGTLTVKGTKFTNLNFLGNLTTIVQLSSFKLAIDIQNNKQLKTVQLPKLKRILASRWESVEITKNHKNLLKDAAGCRMIRTALDQYDGWASPSVFDGLTCEQMGGTGTTKKGGTTKKATTKKASGGIS